MIDLTLLPMFIGAVFILMITPGVDIIYVLSNALSGGTKAGLTSIFGVATGAYIHILCTSFGITAIFMVSDLAYNILKIIGAAYLGYIGYQILISKSGLTNINPAEKRPFFKIYQKGILTNFLNPKAALFTISFVPQFVNPEISPIGSQILILGLFIVAIMILTELPLVLFVGKISQYLKKSSKVSLILDKIVGLVLISLAIKVLISKKD
ncbi:LysE family translocator [Aliarcobacter butzleri]|uniref:LysE family translocator n=1 Tax=Aliarcobacter butzleri TaxID=28197 RepID=UPI001EDC1D5A|nr:LysE family translocator [Aliarcobacter butzleri]MCG3671923.1 LysE family translocator [Aliarcobacter butzleri]